MHHRTITKEVRKYWNSHTVYVFIKKDDPMGESAHRVSVTPQLSPGSPWWRGRTHSPKLSSDRHMHVPKVKHISYTHNKNVLKNKSLKSTN